MIASKWFICIFAEVLPAETVLRIWDCVFAEGYKVLARNYTEQILLHSGNNSIPLLPSTILLQIIFRVALTILITHKSAILACKDIGALATFFRDIFVESNIVTDCHSFLRTMFNLRLKRAEVDQLRRICVNQCQ